MSRRVDYELLDGFLADADLSINEAARLAGCSSWTARKRVRDLAGDRTPMKRPRASTRAPDNSRSEGDGVGVVGCLILGAVVIGAIVLTIAGARHKPGDWPQQYPPYGEPMA
jgi:hypothetical protein